MKIEDFLNKYKNQKNKSIDKIYEKWNSEKVVNDFLGTEIMAGVLLGDAILNGQVFNSLSPDVRLAFSALMGEKANSLNEIRDLIIEKHQISPKSVEGLLNKVQGQYGENIFTEAVGKSATLAESGSQEAWDIKIDDSQESQFIQVKVYKDPDDVIQKIKEVNEKIAFGKIEDVSQVDFAVNSDIYEEVKEKSIELGLENKILNIGVTRDEIRSDLTNNFNSLNEATMFDNFFSDILSSSLSATAIHTAANAFLVWKGAKEKNQALEDILYSSGISAGGIAASMGTRAAIAEVAALTELEIVGGVLFGPIGFVAALGAGYGTREFLKRVSHRKSTTNALESDVEFNQEILSRFEACRKKAA